MSGDLFVSGAAEDAVLAACIQNEQGVSQEQLERALPHLPVPTIAQCLNVLSIKNKIQIFQSGPIGSADATPVFRAVKPEDEIKLKGLSHDERNVFQLIQSASNKGIWTKDLKAQSSLQQPQINKCLKALEHRKLIKAVKSVANGNRKVYMLTELEPSREITGGAWYTGQEYDSEFIKILRQECHRFIRRNKRATVEELSDFVRDSRLSRVALSEEEVLQIVNTLVYDGCVSAHVSITAAGAVASASGAPVPYAAGTVYYTPSALPLKRHSDLTSVPCGVCPVADQCHDGGAISPATCQYYDDWIQLDDVDTFAMPAPRDTPGQQMRRLAAAAAAAAVPAAGGHAGPSRASGPIPQQHRVRFQDTDAMDE